MQPLPVSNSFDLEHALTSERARLVRLCGCRPRPRTGDLIEAWRHADALHDPTGYMKWLNAIARNVCLRWQRDHGKHSANIVALPDSARDFDLEIDLERQGLAGLLDGALALLPQETRTVLIAKYIHEKPLAQIAARAAGLCAPKHSTFARRACEMPPVFRLLVCHTRRSCF